MATISTRKPKPKVPISTMSVTDIKKPPPPEPNKLMQVYTADYKVDYDYVELLHKDKTIISLYKQKCKINVILATYKRDIYTKKCIEALEHSMRYSDMVVKITIIQIEDIPTLQKYAEMKDLDYIFLHIDDIRTKGVFSKALAYDIAYLLSCNMSDTTLFQDCDLIVTENFFKVLHQYYMDKLTWLQAFSKKSVIPIYYSDTIEILNNNIPMHELTDFLNAKNPYLDIVRKNKQTAKLDYAMTVQGACGGSILIVNQLYEQVGGMDPEVCYDYGIEDAMFWTKLITTKKTIDKVDSVHQTDKQYADTPYPLYQYHLYHATLATQNPLYRIMSDMHMEFLCSRHLDKTDYVNMKKAQFAENKQKIKEYFDVSIENGIKVQTTQVDTIEK